MIRPDMFSIAEFLSDIINLRHLCAAIKIS
jgi:hypothetical protein